MTISWVLGSGGLLGSALCRVLRSKETELFAPAERFRWGSEPDISQQLAGAVRAFAARSKDFQQWEIYWAAGAGNMSSSKTDLEAETRILKVFLDLVESSPRLGAMAGALAFASSAGAIYGGSLDYTISENTAPAPTTAYAHEKLRQEEAIRLFVDAGKDRTALLARLSTIYGTGQSIGKQQGLLTHIARCILRNKPVQIYVPLDTIRDYIDADDAAVCMIAALRAINEKMGTYIKIIAAERPNTIAEIIALFKRLTGRAPRVVTSSGRLTNIYARRVRFRSVVAPPCAALARTSLLLGMAKLMAAEGSAYARGAAGRNQRGLE